MPEPGEEASLHSRSHISLAGVFPLCGIDGKVNSTSVTAGRVFFLAASPFDDLSWLLRSGMSLLSALSLGKHPFQER